MTMNIISRVRLFPLLIAVAVVALSARMVDVYVGASLLGETAFAAAQEDTAPAPADQEETPAAPIEAFTLQKESVRDLNTQLRLRRENLEKRERELDLQVRLLEASEKRIDDKIAQLQKLEVAIKDSLRIFSDREEKELQKLVKIYEVMKPKSAAPIIQALETEIQLDIATRMKESKFALILAQMDPQAATEITRNLAQVAEPPTLDELGVAGR